MTRRRPSAYVITIVLLIVAGGCAILIYSRPWVTVEIADSGLGANIYVPTGTELYPVSTVCAWILLACCVGLVATRGRGRFVIGALIVLAGAGVVMGGVAFFLTKSVFISAAGYGAVNGETIASAHRNFWWVAAVAAGLLGFGAGVVVLLKGSRWPSLSSRHERGTKAAATPWDALDRGEDPTSGENLPQ